MEGEWTQVLRKSWRANECLAIAQCVYVATVHDGQPFNHPSTFRSFSPDTGLTCFLDTRSLLYSHLTTSGRCALLWSLPLTNEIYRFPSPTIELIQQSDDLRMVSAWNSLKNREKQGYVGLPPDSFADESPDPLSHDINFFVPQGQDTISPYFSVVVFHPIEVDHTRYIDKTAIGNTRKTFESLPQMEVQPQRWVHRREEGGWRMRKGNASHPCP